jgi:hypothetical protein
MQRIASIVLLLLAASMVLGQEIAKPAQRGSEVDREHTEWIDSVMRSIQTIKPGATRKDLLRLFMEEGGFYRNHRTYAYKQCPYIKVDVDFAPAERKSNGLKEMPQDKISAISRPYLDYFITD